MGEPELTSEKHDEKHDATPSPAGTEATEENLSTSKPPSVTERNTDDTPIYPTGIKLTLILAACAILIFLAALDMTIISTAIPRITDDFHSLDDVAWYGTGFFMTVAAFQSTYGKAYKYFPIKSVALLAIVIFEVGSLICALAPNSTALIIGRAIAGVGGAGISSGTYLIVGVSAPPAKAAALMGVVGASFTIASVCGPLLGGVFTSNLTWRWCFWINLPIGGLAFGIMTLFFKTPAHAKPVKATWKEKVLSMDIVGTALILGVIICLSLVTQWAGVTKSWSSSHVIGTLVCAGLLVIALGFLEHYLGDRAAINSRLIRTRTMGLLMIYDTLIAGTFFSLLYYLPIYFQSISGVSAADSGVRNIPLVAGAGIFGIISGVIIGSTGEYQAVMLVGTVIISIGSGLLYTLDIGTGAGKWIGYQVLAGIGMGLSMQIPIIVAQNVVDPKDLSEASAMAQLFLVAGGAISLTIAQSLFTNKLIQGLTHSFGTERAFQLVAAGTTGIRRLLSGDELETAKESYMIGLQDAYVLSIALACAGVLFSVISIIFDRRKLSKETKAVAAA